MYKGKRIGVLIAAAGSGSRMGCDVPKQFLKIGNKSILRVTADVFERNDFVDDIFVVSPAEHIEQSKEVLTGLAKLHGVCAGGDTRQDSVRLGLRFAMETGMKDSSVILIHDAARPFVTDEIIEGVLTGVRESGAAVCCVPVTDTIYEADKTDCTDRADRVDQHTLLGVPPRDKLFAVQTPQGFDFSLIAAAHECAFIDGVNATDDGSLAKEYGAAVVITAGSYDNRKITTVHDLPNDRADDDARVGIGFDVHAFAAGRKLVLGGVEISYDRGLLGHSDADVLTHALMDAMLGALSLGDIGTHFPDTDERYRGISSMELLAEVVFLICEKGYTVSNADLTIVAEKPRMSSIIPDIEAGIAAALGIDNDRVSVKATTTEGLGFTGREEGIGAQAVVLLRRII